MKKYNEEYFSVFHKRTGKKIADCGTREDARMLISMDPQNREYRVNKMLMSDVIDIEIPKALPTTEIVVNKTSGFGGSLEIEESMAFGRQLSQIKLPEGQGEPVII